MATATHGTGQSELSGARFGHLVTVGILIGIPLFVIVTTIGVYVGSSQSMGSAFLTAVWPGVLMGVFGGGFVGTAMAMNEVDH